MGLWIVLFIICAISALFEGKPLGVFAGIIGVIVCYLIDVGKQKTADKKYEEFKYKKVSRLSDEDEPVDSRHII